MNNSVWKLYLETGQEGLTIADGEHEKHFFYTCNSIGKSPTV